MWRGTGRYGSGRFLWRTGSERSTGNSGLLRLNGSSGIEKTPSDACDNDDDCVEEEGDLPGPVGQPGQDFSHISASEL